MKSSYSLPACKDKTGVTPVSATFGIKGATPEVDNSILLLDNVKPSLSVSIYTIVAAIQ